MGNPFSDRGDYFTLSFEPPIFSARVISIASHQSSPSDMTMTPVPN